MKKTEEQKQAEIINAEKNQKPVKSITISIEWKASRMWGSNPHAAAEVSFKDGTFAHKDGYKCSGCGYDKTSTVIGQIFNDFLLYKLYEPKREYKAWLNGKEVDFPYGVYMPGYLREGSRPSFNEGVGVSCYTNGIAKFIGGKFETVASGKMFDVFTYTDNE